MCCSSHLKSKMHKKNLGSLDIHTLWGIRTNWQLNENVEI
uniref:Uncharacterized protein n=1 Tax=Rhizophora mucronata TaxID=61149 RepID=A0A2P2P8W6_RHIMU